MTVNVTTLFPFVLAEGIPQMDIHIYSFIFFLLIQSLPAGKENLCAADTKGEKKVDEGKTESEYDKRDNESNKAYSGDADGPSDVPSVEYQELQGTLKTPEDLIRFETVNL